MSEGGVWSRTIANSATGTYALLPYLLSIHAHLLIPKLTYLVLHKVFFDNVKNWVAFVLVVDNKFKIQLKAQGRVRKAKEKIYSAQ